MVVEYHEFGDFSGELDKEEVVVIVIEYHISRVIVFKYLQFLLSEGILVHSKEVWVGVEENTDGPKLFGEDDGIALRDSDSWDWLRLSVYGASKWFFVDGHKADDSWVSKTPDHYDVSVAFDLWGEGLYGYSIDSEGDMCIPIASAGDGSLWFGAEVEISHAFLIGIDADEVEGGSINVDDWVIFCFSEGGDKIVGLDLVDRDGEVIIVSGWNFVFKVGSPEVVVQFKL